MSAPGCRFRPLALYFQEVPRSGSRRLFPQQPPAVYLPVNRCALNKFPPQEPSATAQQPSRGDVSRLHPML